MNQDLPEDKNDEDKNKDEDRFEAVDFMTEQVEDDSFTLKIPSAF